MERRPEVETLLVARGNHTEGMKKVLNWLTEGGDLRPSLHAAQHYATLFNMRQSIG